MKTLVASLACIAGAILSAGASANTYTWTSIGYRTPTADDSLVINRQFDDITARAQLAWSDGSYSVSAASTAGHGFILGEAAGVSVGSGNLGHFVNNVYVDWLTLSRPDLAGQSGRVTMSFFFDNSFTAAISGSGQANTYANWYAYGDDASAEVSETYNVGPWAAHTRYGYTDDASGLRQGPVGFDEHYITLTLNFVWGEPFRFGYGLASGGQAVDDGSYALAATGYFAGIVEATAGGVAISDYLLSSRSGTDYSQPTLPVPEVPEPDSIALFAAGLGVFGLREAARRRQRKAATAFAA